MFLISTSFFVNTINTHTHTHIASGCFSNGKNITGVSGNDDVEAAEEEFAEHLLYK